MFLLCFLHSCTSGVIVIIQFRFRQWSSGWSSWRNLPRMGSPAYCHKGRSSIFWKWFLGGTPSYLFLFLVQSFSWNLWYLDKILICLCISSIISLNRFSLWIYRKHFFYDFGSLFFRRFFLNNSSWPAIPGGWFLSYGFQLCAGASPFLYKWAMHYLWQL